MLVLGCKFFCGLVLWKTPSFIYFSAPAVYIRMQASKNCFIFVKLLSRLLFLKNDTYFTFVPAMPSVKRKKADVYTNVPENNMLPKILHSMAPWGLRECWTVGSIFKISNLLLLLCVLLFNTTSIFISLSHHCWYQISINVQNTVGQQSKCAYLHS
jgi:hypothetical protein